MKKGRLLLCVVLIVTCYLFIACSEPAVEGEMATFTINLGGGAERLAWGPGGISGTDYPTTGDLRFEIEFTAISAGTDKTIKVDGPSSGIIQGNIDPGEYDVTLEIYFRDGGGTYRYATGSLVDDTGVPISQVEIVSGPNTVYIKASQIPELGTPTQPFFVYDEPTLKAVGTGTPNNWGRGDYYVLMKGVTLTGAWSPIGASGAPFTGTFDGKDFTISGLSITSPGNDQGLFGVVSGATIQNLGLTGIDINVTSSDNIGGLVGRIQTVTTAATTITNCYVTTGSITANSSSSIGGIVGMIIGGSGGVVEYCYTNVTITGSQSLGGIVGNIQGGPANVRYCYSEGSVTGNTMVGGIVGQKLGTVSNCYATGDIQGNGSIGGVVGFNSSVTVEYCYSTGNITSTSTAATNIGGVVGANSSSASVVNCVALNQIISAPDTTASSIGRVVSSNDVTFSGLRARVDMFVNASTHIPDYGGNVKDGENITSWDPAWFQTIGFTDPWWAGRLPTGP
ncbi:MAG: hypothetical protein FWH19_00725 [Treponema sp.]|nr:hypothetical protein [Treponema sp.]